VPATAQPPLAVFWSAGTHRPDRRPGSPCQPADRRTFPGRAAAPHLHPPAAHPATSTNEPGPPTAFATATATSCAPPSSRRCGRLQAPVQRRLPSLRRSGSVCGRATRHEPGPHPRIGGATAGVPGDHQEAP
jgi:hypothetical protein